MQIHPQFPASKPIGMKQMKIMHLCNTFTEQQHVLLSMHRFLITLALILTGSLAVAQLIPVDLVCSSVAVNGDVTLTWRPKYSTFDFARYEVYHSTQPLGGFNLIDQVTDIAQVSYLHTGAGAHQGPAFYYIKTIAASSATAISDTIAAIIPQAEYINQAYVAITWNALLNSLPASSTGYYRVYYREISDSWVLLDSTASLQYNDTTFVCTDRHYKIEIRDSSCNSVSRIVTVSKDILQPETPVLDSVSVDANGTVWIGWSASTAIDVFGYIVFRQTGMIWDTLAVVSGAGTTLYNDQVSDPYAQSWRYCVAALDHCGNSSADMGIPQAQQTIFLFDPVFEVCNDEIRLNWSPYANLPSGLTGYTVFASENGGGFYLLAQTSSSQLNYTFNAPLDDVKYSFHIRAVGNDGLHTASSPVRHLSVRKPRQPEFAYMRFASVFENRYISMLFHPDTAAVVEGYRLERSSTREGPWQVIRSIEPGQATSLLIDTAVSVSKNIYYYRITVVDSCGAVAMSSNPGCNILLRNPTGNELEWNLYEGWANGIDYFEIYRMTETDSSLVATLGPTETTWTDPDLNPETGARYLVRAVEAPGNPYLFIEESISNIVTIDPEFKLFIPNAFTPFRENNTTFKPIMQAYDAGDYYFAVFNRFGQIIFETTSPSTGWDGKHKLGNAPSGVYVYLVRVLSLAGKYIEQRGMVVLLD